MRLPFSASDSPLAVDSPPKMNGELPNNVDTPITTLAGIFSLSDLLPELPLPAAQPETLNNRSLLFHPRVAEEARRLLSVSSHALLPQLAEALQLTDTADIELLSTTCTDTVSQETPQLLSALRQLNSQLFVDDAVNGLAPAALAAGEAGEPAKAACTLVAVETADLPVPETATCSTTTTSLEGQHVVNDVGRGDEPASAADCSALGVTRDLKVVVKSDPENELLMQRALAEMRHYEHQQQQCSNSVKQEQQQQDDGGPDSDSPDADTTVRNKYFRAKQRQRDLLKQQEREERKRKRQEGGGDDEENETVSEAKRLKHETELLERIKTVRRYQRRSCETSDKVSSDELLEGNVITKFKQSLELILDGAEELDLNNNDDDDDEADVPQEALIPRYRLSELAAGAAQLRRLSLTRTLPPELLVRALALLELNVRDAARVAPLSASAGARDDSDDEDGGGGCRLWTDIGMERVTRGADASLVIMYVLTAPGMPKRVYLEDCIDRVVKFVKYQLENTIFPAFDPVYRAPSKKSSSTPSVGRGRKRAAASLTSSATSSSAVSVSSSSWSRDKSVLALYNKLRELVAALAELLQIQVLTDTCVLQISSMGVAPFFVESISDLQLSSLRLVTTVFSRYPKHRRLLLDDILASIARLPSSKRSLRTYRLSSLSGPVGGGSGGEEQEQVVYIQMLTALVLQLIQCVVTLPNYLASKPATATQSSAEAGEDQAESAESKKDEEGEPEVEVDRDVLIVDRYDTAMRTAHSFLSVFLQKCGSRNEEVDYRPLFENFIQDLLAAVNRPEWPAAECLLSLLGTLLVSNFSNKSTDMALRVSSLDYLGVVAARLRRDAVQSTGSPHLIDSIIAEVQREESRTAAVEDTPGDTAPAGGSGKKKDKKKKKKQESADVPSSSDTGSQRWQLVDAEERRTRVLQRVLLDYLGAAASDDEDQALLHCRHFYLAQWYREAPQEIRRACLPPRRPSAAAAPSRHRGGRSHHRHQQQQRRKQQRRRRRSSACGSSSDGAESSSSDSENSEEPGENSVDDQECQTHINQLVTARRQLLLTKVNVYSQLSPQMTSGDPGVAGGRSVVTCIDYEHAELISKYLASKRPFSHSFDVYLKQIINVLSESAIAVRTKAMKCLTMVVEADPAVLARGDMQMGVHNSFLDHSTAVREAAVDLVGKFLLCRPELIDKYYSMLSARILDTGVSVRKRVIKIMKDICVECPSFSKIPEICVKMIRRINDEEGIRKLVMEVFQAMWFTPVRDREGEDSALLVKVMNITDVVVACQDSGLDWFDQLLNTLFKPKEDKEDSTRLVSEPPRLLLQASAQIVDCLVRHILRLEESQPAAPSSESPSSGSSQRLVACLSTLYLFARIRPALLVQHATTLQPYLSVRCHTRADHLVISHVARTLQLVVPLIEHPSETFLAQLEEDCVKLILQHDRVVIESCIACLGSIVNRVTKNYNLVRDCFKKYYATMKRFREKHEEDAANPALVKCKPFFRRSLFTVGLLLRHFDFKHHQVYSDLGESVVSDVYELLMYFLEQPVTTSSGDLQYFTLQALGFVAVRHYELLLLPRTKQLYDRLLSGSSAGRSSSSPQQQLAAASDTALAAVTRQIRTQVLLNLEVYLVEEEQRMIKQDEDWSKRAQEENLKEMGDVTSGMASTVIQLYLGRVLESFLDSAVTVRHASLKVIQLILSQGLVHPVQIVPYLICMSTDPDERISHTADRQLQDIEKKYPGFIQMKASAGIRLSFQLQQIIQQQQPTRGLKYNENEPPAALNGFLYTLLRTTKQQRRAFAMSCLRNFDEHVKNSLIMLLYLADNLACFPYQVADEVLFIIHQVDVIVSVTGSTILQCVREALLPPPGQVARYQPETGALLAYDDEDEEDLQQLLQRVPADSSAVRLALQASEGCQLLLTLKQHLKEFYGLSDNKIAQYSPSEAGKVYEKSISRRSSAAFEPRLTVLALRQLTAAAAAADGGQAESEEARAKLVAQYLEFKQLMLHIDPADDDEDGDVSVSVADRSSVATPLGIYRTRAAAAPNDTSSPVAAGGMTTSEPARPPITLSLSALSKQAAAAEAATETPAEAASETPAEVETPRVPKLTIVPLRFGGDGESQRSHHKHKHKKSDKHKKKKKKRKRHESGAEGEDVDSDGASDPDYTG